MLLVEDSEDDAALLLHELKRGGYEPTHERVETPEAMREALAGSEWDVVLSDYLMPRIGPSAALSVLRESGSEAPFIVVSGMIGEDVAVEAMRAGAYDYVMKGKLARLCATVARGLEEAEERRKAKRELRRRDAILEALRFTAERLLGGAIGWEESVRAILGRLGEATEASRVYVYENHAREEGEVWGNRRYEWGAPGISTQPDNTLARAIPYKAAGYGRWVEMLGRGEPVHANTRDFPEGERLGLLGQNILSALLVPIFVEGYWWGQIVLADCSREREWSAAEVGALATAAGTLGTAIRRKRIEEKLRASEEEYRAVFELAGAGTAQADTVGGRLLRVNRRFCEITGYSAEELLGMTFEELTHPEDHAEDLERFRRMLNGEIPFYQMEKRYVHKDGHPVWVLLSASLVRDADGKPLYGIGQAQDITERKRAEEALGRREDILQAVRFAAERFLETASWEDSIEEVLDKLGVAAGVSRVYVFENFIGEDGETWADCRYEWVAAGVPSRIDDPSMRAIPYRAFPRWLEMLCRGEAVYAHTRELPENERRELRAQDALDMAMVPIFVEGEWWGVIEFDESCAEREWSAAETDALKAAASTLGAALRRQRAEEALRQSERLYRTVLEQAQENICLVDAETGRILQSNPAFRRTLGYAEEELASMTLYDVVTHDRESIEAHIRHVLEAKRHSLGQINYRRNDGSLVNVEVSASVIPYGQTRAFCVVAHDITERARIQGLLEQRVAALSRISAGLTLDLPVQSTLDVMADSAVRSSTAVACMVDLIDEKTGAIRLVSSFSLPDGYADALRAAHGTGAPSPTLEVLRTRQPALVRGVRRLVLSDPRYAPIHRFVQKVRWDTTYNVPLIYRGRGLGAMLFCYLPGEEPGEEEKVFIKAIADQTAVAVENARLFSEARGKAALEERQRLARELHDSVSQALYGIALGTKAARAALSYDPGRADEPLDYVLSSAEAGLAEMRALIFELRPESLETEGLCAALEKQAAALRARHEIEVQVTLCEEPEASLGAKEAVYRIAQEALHNTIKHAHASSVKVELACGPEWIALEILDDGLGFDPSKEFPGHLGLHSMRERAASLGGTLEVRSVPGEGTRVRARIDATSAAAK